MPNLLVAIIIISFMLPLNSFAGSARSYLMVSCKVVRPAEITVNIPKQPARPFSYTNDQKAMLGDIEVNCPKGTAVTVSYETHFSNEDKNTNEPASHCVNFYKDTNCTEIWHHKQVEYYNSQKNIIITSKIFCKTNNKTLSPGIDKKIVVTILKIDY